MKVTGIQSSLAYKKMGAQKRGDFPQPHSLNISFPPGTSYDNCPPYNKYSLAPKNANELPHNGRNKY